MIFNCEIKVEFRSSEGKEKEKGKDVDQWLQNLSNNLDFFDERVAHGVK